MARRLADWLDARTGYRAWWSDSPGGTVAGGPRLAHSFGVVLLVLLGIEALTGVGLAAFYAPTTTDAWASVHFIQNQVAFGWFVRGLHHHAANALVLVLLVHLMQTVWYGAYRAPREVNWVLGIVLMLLVIIASHTGFLLPNDLRAYWATQVLLGITANQPYVGELAQKVLQGGDSFGNLTLTRFYAMHVLLLPGAIALVLAAHVWLRRRLGATPPPGFSEERAELSRQPYFPGQLVRDLWLSVVVVGALIAVVLLQRGAHLEAPADPSIEYLARPEWYFLPIFRLRHYFTGEQEFIATTVIPGVATVLLMALPFIEALLSRLTSRAHVLVATGVFAGLAVFAAFGAVSEYEDRTDPESVKLTAQAKVLSEEAQRLAMLGVPVSGPLELYQNDPLVWGKRVFDQKCASCHQPCDKTPYEGTVCLEGYASRKWLTLFMHAPPSPYFFGNTKIDEMEAYEGPAENLAAIVEFLYSESERPDADAALAQKGLALYQKEGCESCHALGDEPTETGPSLKGYASVAWLSDFIRNPGAVHFYGELNEMDAFSPDKLSNDELKAVVSYLRSQTDGDVRFESP